VIVIGTEFTEIPTQTDGNGERIAEITFRVIRTNWKLGPYQTAYEKSHEGKSNHQLFFVGAAKISREDGKREERWNGRG
jgi:hypothetical protein